MLLRDHSFINPVDNLLYDDVLLELAEKQSQGEFLRFWESSVYFVVLGRIGAIDSEVNVQQTSEDKIPVLRRSSGGGTVLQGKGCLNYSLVLSKQKRPILNDLRHSYAWISSKVIDALGQCDAQAVFRPISDIATVNDMKISGNAQRRGKNYILHHGTILYDFDLSLISNYLKMPKEMPDYRQGRQHTDFVANIRLHPQSFKNALSQLFECPLGALPPTEQEFLFLTKNKNK